MPANFAAAPIDLLRNILEAEQVNLLRLKQMGRDVPKKMHGHHIYFNNRDGRFVLAQDMPKPSEAEPIKIQTPGWLPGWLKPNFDIMDEIIDAQQRMHMDVRHFGLANLVAELDVHNRHFAAQQARYERRPVREERALSHSTASSLVGGARSPFRSQRNKDDADRMMQGWGSRIGSGQAKTAYKLRVRVMDDDFSVVMPSSRMPRNEVKEEERVILTCRSGDKGAIATIRVALQYQDDPYCPRIYGVETLQSGDLIIEMEMLRPITRDWTGSTAANPELNAYANWAASEPTALLFERSPYMRGIRSEMQCMQDCYWDLHIANAMLRGDQLVITDPLYA